MHFILDNVIIFSNKNVQYCFPLQYYSIPFSIILIYEFSAVF